MQPTRFLQFLRPYLARVVQLFSIYFYTSKKTLLLFFFLFFAQVALLSGIPHAETQARRTTPTPAPQMDAPASEKEDEGEKKAFLVSPRESKKNLFPDEAEEEKKIPKAVQAPRSLVRPIPIDPFNCQRTYTLQGKTYSCDSLLYRDGEKLRPLFEGLPDAISELNLYQKNKRIMTGTAYVSTIGILVFLIANTFKGDSSERTPPLGWVAYSGLALSAGSFTYGFVLGKTNEKHLKNAIEFYNQAHPDEPIEIQISTTFSF